MSVGFSFIGILLGILAIIGLGLLVGFLGKQLRGTKQAMEEGRQRMADFEDKADPPPIDDGEGNGGPGGDAPGH